MEDEEVGDAGPVNEEKLAKQLQKSKDYFKCGTCQGNPIKHKSLFSRREETCLKHDKFVDAADERDAWRQSWARQQVELSAGGAELRRQHIQAEVARVHDAPAVAPAERPEGPWKMNFGKYSKPPLGPATIDHIMRVDPEYFPELMRQTPAGQEPFSQRPQLTEELKKAGVWTQCLQQSAKLRVAKNDRSLVTELSGAAQSLHRDERALHDLNVQEARASAEEQCPSSIVEVQADQDLSRQRLERRRKRKRGYFTTRAQKSLNIVCYAASMVV